MSDVGIMAVIALGERGIEFDGWVRRCDWESRDERLTPLFRPVHATIPLDGVGYNEFVRRARLLLEAAEQAWQAGGHEAAKAVIERHGEQVAPPVL